MSSRRRFQRLSGRPSGVIPGPMPAAPVGPLSHREGPEVVAGSEHAGPALGGFSTTLPVTVSEANGAAPPGTEAPVGRTEDRHAGAALATNANDLQHSGEVRVPPILGVPSRVKRGARVPAWRSNGWELPVRRAWYGVNDGRATKARPLRPRGPGWAAEPSRRAGGVRVSAANRPVPARPWGWREGTQKVVGPKSA
jgi:hypothetical protein